MTAHTLIDSSQIHARVTEMGVEISNDLAGQDVIVLCVLKGALFFTADLMRAMKMDAALDFIQVSSYGNKKQSSGVVTLHKEPQLDPSGKAVLIVEDIIDSGLSMSEVHRYMEGRGATVVKVATFLDKPASRRVPFKADYVGFTIEPKFVVGYGLDFDEKYRGLSEIQVLED